MEDEQKLKLLRLSVDNASNFDEAKAYASFIFGFKEPFATRTPPDDGEYGCKHEYIEDGVYFVEDGCKPVRFTDSVCVQSPKYCNVMVSYHGHKWIVAKEDIGDDKLPLLSKDAHPEDTSSLYMCEIDALNEFDMFSCTEHLRKAGLAFELDADLCIPTAGQLAAMFLFRKELNKALEMVGGTPMKEDAYWSSSEISADFSWLVFFDGGNGGYGGYKSNGYYVRPCRTCELKGNSTHKG